jgi:hypothetical protein
MTLPQFKAEGPSASPALPLLLLIGLMPASWCYAADLVVIQPAVGPSRDVQNLEVGSRFYGLDLKTVELSGPHASRAMVSQLLEQQSTVAVAIAARALPLLDRQDVLKAIHRGHNANIPLLIFGVEQDADPAALAAWSNGEIIGTSSTTTSSSKRSYVFGHVQELTRQLSDLEIPIPSTGGFVLIPSDSNKGELLAWLKEEGGTYPVFVRVSNGNDTLFIASAVPEPIKPVDGWGPNDMVNALPQIAPAFIYLNYSGGARVWKATHHYANLTIDDAWLREPYGNLDYDGLLKEMAGHRFHSTIAFIPWNYDRSQSAVASLIRNHPDSFSICVHGDNHDHKEFTDYQDKPLALQVNALKQSLARMDRFESLTGIQYDKVMVFPHSIAPEDTLAALKTYNYVATTNSWNVPMDRKKPMDISYALRPVTLAFGDFPSVTRYSVEGQLPHGFIQMQQFLGNPLVFYCHQGYFSKAIGQFDQVADEVNRSEPHTRWRGLGEIAKHLYEVKLRDDSDYDVLAFTSSISLENTSDRELTFHIQKQESGHPEIAQVNLDGRPSPYQIANGNLNASVTVPPGSSRDFSIAYVNDTTVAPVSVARDSVVVYLLRMTSDFRDLVLSQNAASQWLVRFYYDHDLTPEEAVAGPLALALALIIGVRFLLRRIRRPLRTVETS